MRTEISVNPKTTYVVVDLPDFNTVIKAPDGSVHEIPEDPAALVALAGGLDQDGVEALFSGILEHMERKGHRMDDSIEQLKRVSDGVRSHGAESLIAATRWPADVEKFYEAEQRQWEANGWTIRGSSDGSFKITSKGMQAIIDGNMPSPTEDNFDTVSDRMRAAERLQQLAGE